MLEGKYSSGVGEIDRVHFSGVFWALLHNCLTKYFINWVDSTDISFWCQLQDLMLKSV